jgi:hypothetical protein
MPEEPATEGELRKSLSLYERELSSVTEKLREVRKEAREETIAASACRQGVDSVKIQHWKDSIARLQSEALSVQGKIGETNRKLRALRASTNHQHNRRGRDREAREELFLSCFFTVVRDSVDPRLFQAFQEGAHKLAADHAAMHGKDKEEP